MLATLTFAAACCLWAVSERVSASACRRTAHLGKARAMAAIGLRDAILETAGDAIAVFDASQDRPLHFGGAAALIEACSAGPDSDTFEAARHALLQDGLKFDLTARTPDNRKIALRGSPIGGHTVIYLREVTVAAAPSASEDDEIDFRAALDGLPTPAWIRGKDLSLRWVNRALLAVSGFGSKEEVIERDFTLERSERDLASAAQDGSEPVKAKRYATVDGERRPYSFFLNPLAGGSVAGAAFDLASISKDDPARNQQMDAYAATLNWLGTGVAIFGSDYRLAFHNRSYANLLGLQERWLDLHPSLGEILDRLRETRRLPEQSNYAAWKNDQMKPMGHGDNHSEELWHLPDGKSLRRVTKPHPCGGLIVLFEDVTERLRLESSYKSQIKVQKATLESFQEGIAVFGPDGRLKLHNQAFAQQWRFNREDLKDEPHMKRLAELCAARFGKIGAWEAVSRAVNAATVDGIRTPFEVERLDGRMFLLSVTRLPDSATLVNFVDVTDQTQIESALCECPLTAAGSSQ